jgi:prepilin-type N-terminal cleavage/methylation domain-containing protein
MQSPSQRAFSLVELAIVLVIIGLLFGGVLAGRSLIKAAGLRGTIAQYNDIYTAMTNFHDRYAGLPGDITNAAGFWPGLATNGNGDGTISAAGTCPLSEKGNDPDCGAFDGERPQFFKQLSLAGMLGGYDGSTVLGKGYPAIKAFPGQGMFISGPWVTPLASNMFAENYATDKLYLYMGVCLVSDFPDVVVSGTFNDCGIFPPQDAYNIDMKIDDGLPLSGKMIGESYSQQCVSGTSYNMALADPACNPMISLSR